MSRAVRETDDAEVRNLEQVEAPLSSPPESSFAYLSVNSITPSKTNPRGKLDKAALEEMTESVRRQGVLSPVLVRHVGGSRAGLEFELVAGHRRLAAAKAAGLETIPATIRTLTDTEALELQLLENLQRSDLTPLEEAEGYQRLSKSPGYDVARVAEKVGRSAKYVYDRMRLLALGKDARALLAVGTITAGHAILLARLKPADQARALKEGALLEHEEYLFDVTDGEEKRRLKAVSVRELSGWIDKNVRMEPDDVDPMLFPEAALRIGAVPKVVAITHLHYVPDDAREGKTYFPQSWKRADGLEKSKACEHSTLGFIAVGPHRGEAFEVCVAKDKCTTHWGSEIRDRKKRVNERANAPAAPAKKADSPEQQARRAALEKALSSARDVADKAADVQLAQNAAATDPESFIRKFAKAVGSEFLPILKGMGEKVSAASAVEGWISQAPIAQVQRAIVIGQTEFYEDEIYGAFGVDRGALRDLSEKAARDKVKLQTSAKSAKASPKKKAS